MSSLNIFPVEVLELITSVLFTPDQVHLWQCGDSILNTKLAQGGLKSTSLQWSSVPWMPWPRSFFTVFTGLRVVNWNVVTRSSLCPALELNLLPSTLQRLQLDCEDTFCLLRKQNVKLNEFFPSLQVLKLQGKRLREENLKQLPPNLLELSVSESGLSFAKIESKVIFRDLPTTIEHLKFDFEVVDLEEFGNDLPSGLTYLLIQSIKANFDWFAKLPKSLTKLIISMQGALPDWHSLPPQLEELSIFHFYHEISISSFASLPIHLKSLKFFCLNIKDDGAALLPKKLTRLEIDTPALSRAPAGITHVGLLQLPPTLTEYNFSVKVTHPEILSFYNPETTTINLQRGSFVLQRIPFPARLSSLTIDVIDDDICELLPPQLTLLKAARGLITTKGASKLPKSLKTLDINVGVFDTNETISYLGYIPEIYFCSVYGTPQRNLTEDWLSFLRPKKSLPSSSDAENDMPELICPRSDANCGDMAKLDVWIDESPHHLGEASFRSLSTFTHLSVLHIQDHWQTTIAIPAHFIQFVPKSLTELKFGKLSEFPTSLDLSTLPKCLRSLELFIQDQRTCSWKDEDFELLPRSLQILHVIGDMCSFPNLTDGVLRSLPPYLSNMGLNIAGFRFSAFDRMYGAEERPFGIFGQPFGSQTGFGAPSSVP